MSGEPATWRIERLQPQHDRAGFSCGVDPLDRYIRTQAGQDLRRRVASCFVMLGAGSATVVGYYSLSAASIELADLPESIARKLPRYPSLPATLMGRLAVDSAHRGKRLGEALLMDALARALRSEIASFAFVVDAKDEIAATFYARYGFLGLGQHGQRLYLPMTEIATLFA